MAISALSYFVLIFIFPIVFMYKNLQTSIFYDLHIASIDEFLVLGLCISSLDIRVSYFLQPEI